MEDIILTGRVVSGVGEGRYFTQLDWVREQFVTNFGFDPAPGTFNVRINPEQTYLLRRLDQYRGVKILPPDNKFCAAKCFPVKVGVVKGVLVTPLVEGYSEDVMEIMAPVNMRQSLNIKDDDIVEVCVLVKGCP